MAHEHHPGCEHREEHQHHHLAHMMGRAACDARCQNPAHHHYDVHQTEQHQLAADEEYDELGNKRKKKVVSLQKARPINVEKARLPMWQLLAAA